MPETCEIIDFEKHRPLPFGTVIYGKVTVGDVKKDVIVRADEMKPERNSYYFLGKMQKVLNEGKDLGEECVMPERIEYPDRAQVLKLAKGVGWYDLDAKSEKDDEDASVLKRIINYCRNSIQSFCGIH